MTELLSNGVLIAGKMPDWERLNGNMGVIGLDPDADAQLIEGLNKMVGSAGIVKISEADATEKKRQYPYRVSKPNWLDAPLKLANLKKKPARPPQNGSSTAPVAGNVAANEGKPPEVPQAPPDRPDFENASFRPATARIGKQTPAGSGDI